MAESDITFMRASGKRSSGEDTGQFLSVSYPLPTNIKPFSSRYLNPWITTSGRLLKGRPTHHSKNSLKATIVGVMTTSNRTTLSEHATTSGWLIDFNGMSTRLRLFYAWRLENCVHWTLFLKVFAHSYMITSFGLVWFYGISTIVGYLMPNPFLYK